LGQEWSENYFEDTLGNEGSEEEKSPINLADRLENKKLKEEKIE
jgi:hypothetical protein